MLRAGKALVAVAFGVTFCIASYKIVKLRIKTKNDAIAREEECNTP